MSKVNVYGSFIQALFFSSNVSVPKYFLNSYSELGISHIEALLIIQIMSEIETNPFPPAALFAERMKLEISQVEEMIAHLLMKNYLSIETYWNSTERKTMNRYSLTGLIDELAERWAIEHMKRYEEEQKQQKLFAELEQGKTPAHPAIERIIRTFEQELGRPLTAIECETINGWISAKFSEDLILEAFKRGVLAGIRSFRYIDSILREWEKKGLRTLAEVEADDAYFQSRQEKSTRSKSQSKSPNKISPHDKYENFYL